MPGQPPIEVLKEAALPLTSASPATHSTQGGSSGGMTPICTTAWILRCEFVKPASFDGVQPTAVTLRSYLAFEGSQATRTVNPPVAPTVTKFAPL